MSAPKAVLISDIHFSVQTLELASKALIQAFDKALELKVSLIIAGDLLDSKAIIRAECANRLIEIFEIYSMVDSVVLVGNHDMLNERSSDHSLHFLSPYTVLVDSCIFDSMFNVHFIPYQNDPQTLVNALESIPKGSTIIAHQGLQTAFLGHYVQDKTSLPPEAFDGYRVISGHYHRHQTIKCGETGLWTYIGSPYSVSFAEAYDGPKGFLVLYKDGSVEQIPTNLRKHVVVELRIELVRSEIKINANSEDLVWLKVTGSKSELDALNKNEIGQRLLGHSNYKLDKIPTDKPDLKQVSLQMTDSQIFDELLDKQPESFEQRAYLKELWRDILQS